MPANDPISDKYTGGAGVTRVEFEGTLFEDIEDGDIFWFSNSANSNENHAFRKLDYKNAMDTRNRTVSENINNRKEVYQKI